MAHILTFEEMLSDPKELICEFRWGIEPQPFSLEWRKEWIKQGRQYGKTWRCWTDKPDRKVEWK